jgi:chromate transporter
MKNAIGIFFAFLRVGLLTFGGGYSMLPIAQRELVERRRWVSETDVMEAYALSQCLPGILAVNTSIFLGHKVGDGRKSALYGTVAALGVVFPSLVIITLIAAFLSNFTDIAWVQKAFAGIRVCVVVMILRTVVKMRKNALTDAAAWGIFAAVFLLSAFTDITPILFVLLAIGAGIAITALKAEKVAR